MTKTKHKITSTLRQACPEFTEGLRVTKQKTLVLKKSTKNKITIILRQTIVKLWIPAFAGMTKTKHKITSTLRQACPEFTEGLKAMSFS